MEENKKEKEKIHRLLLETVSESEEKEREFEIVRFKMEGELELKKLQLTGVEGDVRSHVSVLTNRLDLMMDEKVRIELCVCVFVCVCVCLYC